MEYIGEGEGSADFRRGGKSRPGGGIVYTASIGESAIDGRGGGSVRGGSWPKEKIVGDRPLSTLSGRSLSNRPYRVGSSCWRLKKRGIYKKQKREQELWFSVLLNWLLRQEERNTTMAQRNPFSTNCREILGEKGGGEGLHAYGDKPRVWTWGGIYHGSRTNGQWINWPFLSSGEGDRGDCRSCTCACRP